jgi:hypothetical protein
VGAGAPGVRGRCVRRRGSVGTAGPAGSGARDAAGASPASGGSDRRDAQDALPARGGPDGSPAHRPRLTAAGLQSWQESGASWRALEVDEDRVLVELCACTGERVDVLAGVGTELVAFVRDCGLSSG